MAHVRRLAAFGIHAHLPGDSFQNVRRYARISVFCRAGAVRLTEVLLLFRSDGYLRGLFGWTKWIRAENGGRAKASARVSSSRSFGVIVVSDTRGIEFYAFG